MFKSILVHALAESHSNRSACVCACMCVCVVVRVCVSAVCCVFRSLLLVKSGSPRPRIRRSPTPSGGGDGSAKPGDLVMARPLRRQNILVFPCLRTGVKVSDLKSRRDGFKNVEYYERITTSWVICVFQVNMTCCVVRIHGMAWTRLTLVSYRQ